MKREIKFRAWCEGTHEGITFSTPTMEYGVTLSPKGNYCDVESGWDIHGEYPTVPIMQFTGLTANGKEIYEGDILSQKWRVEVYMDEDGAYMVKFHTNPKMNHPISLRKYILKRQVAGTSDRDCVIIGNIYENPELL